MFWLNHQEQKHGFDAYKIWLGQAGQAGPRTVGSCTGSLSLAGILIFSMGISSRSSYAKEARWWITTRAILCPTCSFWWDLWPVLSTLLGAKCAMTPLTQSSSPSGNQCWKPTWVDVWFSASLFLSRSAVFLDADISAFCPGWRPEEWNEVLQRYRHARTMLHEEKP